MTSDCVIAARIPKTLKDRIKEAVKKYGYTNEGDLLREAIRLHLFALERAEPKDEPTVS
jgi:Arc/MetJ-type ribon-helix-helix transcriptional regulator